MADIQVHSKNGSVRQNPRIDLTPMVDLGFLLLTFFIMTTSMTKPKTMEIQMPYTPSPPAVAFYETSAITLMPAQDNRLFYYEGIYDDASTVLKELSLSKDENLRDVLIKKQQAIANRPKVAERDVQVVVKAHATATVNNIIQVLDEMKILKIDCVAMVDISSEEVEKINLSLVKH